MFVELIIIILYYVVYQIYKDGQTYGKKLMKIKIVSTKGDLTMNQMIFRTCFSTSLLINLFSLFVLTFSSKYAFFYGTLSFENDRIILEVTDSKCEHILKGFRIEGVKKIEDNYLPSTLSKKLLIITILSSTSFKDSLFNISKFI